MESFLSYLCLHAPNAHYFIFGLLLLTVFNIPNGIFTLIVCRFLPFGIRNALFLTSGMRGMFFGKFALRDGLAALLSTTVLCKLGYTFGANDEPLLGYIKNYEHLVAGFAIIALAAVVVAYFRFYKARML